MSVETSTELAALAEALAKAQGRIANAAKRAENPMFASFYADLASVWDACREALSENGLSIVQAPAFESDGGVSVTTTLLHSSGQWMRSTLWMPLERRDSQGVGSIISYARRYALTAMVGVAQRDDDGQAAREPLPTRIGGFSRPADNKATFDQLTVLEALRERAGLTICGDLLEVCPWHTKKYSKRQGQTVDKDVLCAYHHELAQWKTAAGEDVREPAQLTFDQCDLLIANFRKKADRKERRAATDVDLSIVRERSGPFDGHATMPKAEHDAGTVLRALGQSDMTEQELCAHFGKDTVGELTYGDVIDALALIGDYGTERYELTVARLKEKQSTNQQETA